jgi:hypothetical protein
MKNRSKDSASIYKFLGIIILINIIGGVLILWSYSIEDSKIELNKNIKFEADRTILKMKKDSLVMILNKWQTEKSDRFKNLVVEDDWITWVYDKRYHKGIMEEILGDESKYKKDTTILKNDVEKSQLRFKVKKDTAYVYVRFITQYYSLLN